VPQARYQDAIDRALALRLRAKKESDPKRREALLYLAQEWESWAEHCRDRAAKGEAIDPANKPAEDIE
jgi:hypothetical protein